MTKNTDCLQTRLLTLFASVGKNIKRDLHYSGDCSKVPKFQVTNVSGLIPFRVCGFVGSKCLSVNPCSLIESPEASETQGQSVGSGGRKRHAESFQAFRDRAFSPDF